MSAMLIPTTSRSYGRFHRRLTQNLAIIRDEPDSERIAPNQMIQEETAQNSLFFMQLEYFYFATEQLKRTIFDVLVSRDVCTFGPDSILLPSVYHYIGY